MIFKKLRKLIYREREFQDLWNRIIPEGNHVRTMTLFLRSYCSYEDNRLYYCGYEINMSVVNEFSCTVLIGGEEVSVTYPLNEHKEIYEVRKLLDSKIQDIWNRNYNIYRALAIDLGVHTNDISGEDNNRTMVLKTEDGQTIKFDISNVGETSIKLFRDHLKIFY